MQTYVEPIKAFRGQPNAQLAADFYAGMAAVLSRDTEPLSVGQFRQLNEKGRSLAYPPGESGGLSQAIDAALTKVIGLEDKAVDKPRAAEVCRAIAWALTG